jgi:hypothetical protein
VSNRIYIAGSSNEIPLIRGFIRAVETYGYAVTHDWTRSEGWDMPDPSHEFLHAAAIIDFQAVLSADFVWYVAPEEKSEGSATELGVALANALHGRTTTIVSGPIGRNRIFPRMAQIIFPNHSEVLEYLRVRIKE